jgi:hypothetical protein
MFKDLIDKRDTSRAKLERLIEKLESDEAVDIGRLRAAIYAYSVLLQFINASKDDSIADRFDTLEAAISRINHGK